MHVPVNRLLFLFRVSRLTTFFRGLYQELALVGEL